MKSTKNVTPEIKKVAELQKLERRLKNSKEDLDVFQADHDEVMTAHEIQSITGTEKRINDIKASLSESEYELYRTKDIDLYEMEDDSQTVYAAVFDK